jgi:hypothetical protein
LDLTPKPGLVEILLYPENTDKEVIKASQRYMITNIAKPEALQLKTALELGEFYSIDGKINYTENLKNIQIPTLMILGRRGSSRVWIYHSFSIRKNPNKRQTTLDCRKSTRSKRRLWSWRSLYGKKCTKRCDGTYHSMDE